MNNLGNFWEIVKNVVINMFIWLFVDIEFLVFVFNLILNWIIEEKFYIYGCFCIFFYFNIYLVWEVLILFVC